ncbi:hypothetical protein DSO57_1003649 [Entomophthora muscae]|uniref:Uncharacterized protein n=1 Tax=Entomophthora muscae TaxID=34485 RepID=A0ACC2SLH6_9FUNG|nr:hypothetical protein DSO57_1003649 [Entomophthora muscae]
MTPAIVINHDPLDDDIPVCRDISYPPHLPSAMHTHQPECLQSTRLVLKPKQKWQGVCTRRNLPEQPHHPSGIRFLVKQSTIAKGHFHFYPQDKQILQTPLLGNGKTKQCLRFSPFGDCLDFSLQTDNGVNLAWIQFKPDPVPRFKVDLNRSGRMAWACPAVRLELDLPWPGLPRLILPTQTHERRFRFIPEHPQVSDGLALVDLSCPNKVIAIYFLPSHSVREGFLDFFPDESKTPLSSEDLILFTMLLSISLATFPKPEPLARNNSIHSLTSPSKKKSDLLFERTHVW